MSRYSIDGNVLTALGDVIRDKSGQYTKWATVPLIENCSGTAEPGSNNTAFGLFRPFEYQYALIKLISEEGVRPTIVAGTSRTVDVEFDDNNEFKFFDQTYREIWGDWGFNLTIRNKNGDEPYTFEIHVSYYDWDGCVIGNEEEVFNSMTPGAMVDAVRELNVMSVDNIEFSYDQGIYCFAGGAASRFIEMMGDKITTNNISNATKMFYKFKLGDVPFDINFYPDYPHKLSNMFEKATELRMVPRMNNLKPDAMDFMFFQCSKLETVDEGAFEGTDWSLMDEATSSYTGNKSQMFGYCHNLREFPRFLFEHANPVVSANYTQYKSTFFNCYCLREISEMPIPYTATYTGSGYSGMFDDSFLKNCHCLKRFTFEQYDEQKPWANQLIDLSQYVGWASGSDAYFLRENLGEHCELHDEDSYNEWMELDEAWTQMEEYSRYNKDSAVETLNSLPDCSATGSNTIKFKGNAGSATHAGAINTMSEEEIAVATAKGWTVSFV